MKKAIFLILFGLVPMALMADANQDLFKAAEKGSATGIEAALKNGANPNFYMNGSTALMIAAYKGSPECLKVLLKAGADINAVSDSGTSVLQHAAAHARQDNVKVLIEHGVKVNVKNKYGHSPLSVADEYGYTEVSALLRAAGAKGSSPLKPSESKHTALSAADAAGPRICLAFDSTGALTCRDMPGSRCPGNRFWAGPGPCSTYKNKTVQQLNKTQWGNLIAAFNGEAEDRDKVNEPKQQSKIERCQKACRQKKCGSKLSGEYTASVSASLRCAGFCDQECSTYPDRYR
jgi:uncharacterized protein